MNADRLLAQFERISDAPDAIPRMRRFILDLAVRGKLVEQDPEDEPAEIWFHKLRSLPTGSINGIGQPPFDLPSGWLWLGFSNLFNVAGGIQKTPNRTPRSNPFPYLGVGNVYRGRLDLSVVKHFELEPGELDRRRLEVGDLLVIEGNGSLKEIGRCAKWGGEIENCVHQNHVIRCRPFSAEISDFAILYLNSPWGMEIMQQLAITSSGLYSLSVGKIRKIEIPLPPLAEQHRIVSKVDELMALCDQLEAARQQWEQGRERLMAATLQRLNHPAEDPSTFRKDASFALQVLPSLTTSPAQIKQLRQTILNLAVRGKLVEQDPEDEPAEELLAWIEADRKLLSSTKGHKHYKSIQSLPTETQPCIVPASWAWVHFGDIMYSRDGERIPVSKDERSRREKIYDYYGASGVIDRIDGYLFDKPLLLVGEDGANLLNRSTPIAFIARGKYWVNNHAHVLDGISEEFLRFIELSINATDLAPYVTGTAQPKMNQAKMNSIPIALPPLAEQHRIVAKVDELMALCDQLEQQVSQADQQRRRLLEALLAEALVARLSAEEESHAHSA
jgi:type I restriction enzyme S subunit